MVELELERSLRATGTTLAFALPFGWPANLLRSCRTKYLTLVARENAETAHAIEKKIVYLSGMLGSLCIPERACQRSSVRND
jgi:hypothetical protein